MFTMRRSREEVHTDPALALVFLLAPLIPLNVQDLLISPSKLSEFTRSRPRPEPYAEDAIRFRSTQSSGETIGQV